MSVQTEFPNFDGDLPVIDGFEDTSYRHDICPSLTNKELGLQLFVDYADPDLSEYPDLRRSGDVGRFRLVSGEATTHLDDLGERLAEIAKVKNTSSFAP